MPKPQEHIEKLIYEDDVLPGLDIIYKIDEIIDVLNKLIEVK